MDPVTATSAARDAPGVARAAGPRTADPAATAGGVAAKGTTFTKVLQAATEGSGSRGVGSQVTTAEAHTTVSGHRYSRITAGLREGSYLNTSGNTRHGQAFALVERAGRTFHVYGEGAERRVVEVKPRAAAAPVQPPAATPPAATPSPAAPAVVPPATTSPVPDGADDEPAGPGGLAAPDDT